MCLLRAQTPGQGYTGTGCLFFHSVCLMNLRPLVILLAVTQFNFAQLYSMHLALIPILKHWLWRSWFSRSWELSLPSDSCLHFVLEMMPFFSLSLIFRTPLKLSLSVYVSHLAFQKASGGSITSTHLTMFFHLAHIFLVCKSMDFFFSYSEESK